MSQAMVGSRPVRKKQRLQVRVRTSTGKTLWAMARRLKLPVGQRLSVQLDVDDPVVASTSSSSSSTEPEPDAVFEEDEDEKAVLDTDEEVLEGASQTDPGVLLLPRESGAASYEEMLRGTLQHRVGMAWYILWRRGDLDDEMVIERYGDLVLEMFKDKKARDEAPQEAQEDEAQSMEGAGSSLAAGGRAAAGVVPPSASAGDAAGHEVQLMADTIMDGPDSMLVTGPAGGAALGFC